MKKNTMNSNTIAIIRNDVLTDSLGLGHVTLRIPSDFTSRINLANCMTFFAWQE